LYALFGDNRIDVYNGRPIYTFTVEDETKDTQATHGGNNKFNIGTTLQNPKPRHAWIVHYMLSWFAGRNLALDCFYPIKTFTNNSK